MNIFDNIDENKKINNNDEITLDNKTSCPGSSLSWYEMLDTKIRQKDNSIRW